MLITNQRFDQLVRQALESLPAKIKTKINNLAIFIEDWSSQKQLNKIGLRPTATLFGLFEGYAQAKKLNYGSVLPDRITIFRQAIIRSANSSEEIKEKIINTVKHEIAHHFGSDEAGARRASK